MSRLLEVLADENAKVLAFIGLLSTENAALKDRAVVQLESITEQKQEVIGQLNELAQRRADLVALPQDPVAQRQYMQKWFGDHPGERDALKLWDELLVKAADARNLHEANQKLVSLLLKTTNEALDILMKPPIEQVLYDSDGQATAKSGSRIIDSA